MKILRVSTQDELDAALASPAPHEIWICGTGRFVLRQSAEHFVRATESAHVVARGSAHVVARESAHVVARESAHVEAWGSAHVVAWESAHVVARGAVMVRARDRAQIKAASTLIVVMNHAKTTTIKGGTIVEVPPITTAAAWCEYYGVEVTDGVATLYKGVHDDYRSDHGFAYLPGSVPVAPDWDGGTRECGGGLHFCARPAATKDFDSSATKFLACPVKLEDIRPPREGDSYPSKLKARGCCAPVYEVDIYGKAVAAAGSGA